MHFYYRKTRKHWSILPPHKNHYSYSYLPNIFTVNTIQAFSMYVYTFKNGIVLYYFISDFFHLAYWEHPAIVLKCISFTFFLRVVCFPQNWFKFCPIVAHFNCVQFSAVINEVSLNDILMPKSLYMSLKKIF